MSRNLTPNESIMIQDYYEKLRTKIKRGNALENISGGFCTAKFDRCDRYSIFLHIRYGTSNEGGSYVTEELYELDREDLEILHIRELCVKINGEVQ